MELTKFSLGIASFVLVAGMGVAHAQMKLPGLGGLTGNTNAAQGTESVTNDTLVQSFIATNQEILTAQKFLALAYGQKDKAALLEAEAQALQSSGVGADELKKAVELSNKTNEELAAMQAEQTQLSEEGKKSYLQSLPHFVRGVAGTKQLVDQVEKFGANAKGSLTGGSMLGAGMGKMKSAMFVAEATPNFAKGVFDTFRKTVSIGQSNKVKMPADATSALAGLAP
jgi:hypothetical protein